MSKVAVLVLAVLLAVGLYFPGVNSLSASEEAEAKEEMAQDEEKMDDGDVRQMMYEEREAQDDPDGEEAVPEEERDLPDDAHEDDRGDK